MRQYLAAIALACAFATAATAQVSSLEGATLGEHWYGPNYSLDDLKGRIVVIEMWGYN